MLGLFIDTMLFTKKERQASDEAIWIMRKAIHMPHPGKVNQLKKQIRSRLDNEDYTCKIPKPSKTRVRVKLHRDVYEYGGYVAYVWR